MVGRAEALRRILDHGNVAAPRGDGADLVHVGGLAVQAHRHDGAGAIGDRRIEQRRVHVGGVGLDVDEHRLGADQRDDFGGGDESERRGHDFIAGPDAERHERDHQRVGAARDRDAVAAVGVGGEALLELAHLGTEDVLAVIEHGLDARIDVAAQRPVL